MKNQMIAQTQERDGRQRSLGFIGFSAIAHVTVLAVLLVTVKATKQIAGAPQGNRTEPAVEMDLKEMGSSEPNREVLLEDTTSTANAVVVAPPAAPVPPSSQPRVAAPAKTIAVKVAPNLVTTKESDVEIKKALAESRDDQAPENETNSGNRREEKDVAAASPQKDDTRDEKETDKSEEPEKLSPVIAADPEPEPQEASPTEKPAPAAVAATRKETSQAPVVAPPVAAANPAPAAKQTAPANGQGGGGSGPSNAPQGRGNGYGAPTGSQMVVIDASLRKPLAGNAKAIYPQQDRIAHRQGTAVLIGRVSPDGRITGVAVERGSGSVFMDRAAIDAFQKWRFAPGSEAVVRQPFNFVLTGQEQVVPARLGSR